MKRFWETQVWLNWWNGLSAFSRVWPLLAAAVYWVALGSVGGLRLDLLVFSVAPVVLYYLGPKYRAVLQFVLPLCLISAIYDSQRYYSDLIRGPIHVREPYEFDKRFFGIETAAGRLTPNEWWQLHTNAFLDFVCGLAYIIFIPVYFGSAIYMRFWLTRKGTAIAHPRSIAYRAPQIMWAFFWVNLIGYSTYYWYAASPPWYVALYGLGPARLDVAANVAGCGRFDALVGIPVFREWYGKSADVHGAIPSLHIAYPLMMAYYAMRFGALRVWSIFFFGLMCFSAVYLNHHYILDIIWGSVYALATAFTLDMAFNWNAKRKGIVIPGDDPELSGQPA